MNKRLCAWVCLFLLLVNSNLANCDKLKLGAQSAVLMDVKSKRALIDYNAHTRLPIASTTKIMTALMALEKGNLSDFVKIGNESVGIEGSSIYLEDGEFITLEDLLYGLLLRSGNDSAIAIANHISEDLEGFVDLMNIRAKQIGAKGTNFKNPHGLHNENHYSTAYDLALITAKAMEIDKFKEIVNTKIWKANRSKNNIFYNKNKTLWEYEGGDGVKIGYTSRAGRCLVSSATRGETQLIAVVINDRNWFDDCYKLMDYGFDNYSNYIVYEEEQLFRKIPIKDGNKEYSIAVAKESFSYPLKKDELKKIKMHTYLPDRLKAPIKKGENLGNVTIFLDGKMINRGDIISKENIERMGFIKQLIKRLRR